MRNSPPKALALLLCAALLATAQAYPRSSSVRTEFRKANPCPATGKTTGRCENWEIDHRIALMCGGPDAVDNLQWLTIPEHRKKTARERRECRRRGKQ